MIGKQIEKYKIISLLGEGGMANVFLAEHETLGHKVAFKLLKEDFIHRPNIRKRFLAEAKNLAKMNHPNIIKVTDLIDAGDIVAFAMEYIDGDSLEEYLVNKGELSDQIIKNLFNQMVFAVEYVHSQGLIHRDIKPSNFMINRSRELKLLDFGIAKNSNELQIDYTKTGMHQQMGTPLYMSPEQIKSTSEVTKQTDIYSLGVVLWQMVMGKKPYDASILSLPEMQVSILKENLPLTNTTWDSIITNATHKDPNKRALRKDDFDKTVIDSSLTDIKKNKQGLFSLKNSIIGILSIVIVTFFVYVSSTKTNETIKKEEIAQENDILVDEKDEVKRIEKENDLLAEEKADAERIVKEKELPAEEKAEAKRIAKEKDRLAEEKAETDRIAREKIEQEKSKFKIGQKYQGGIIFYLDYSGKHGKICAEKDLGKYSWGEAKNACDKLSLNGYDDWDLPTLWDLAKLYKLREVIGGFNNLSYWSGIEEDNGDADCFSFNFGIAISNVKDATNYVRAVRAF